MEFISVPKASQGDKVAVISPSFAAPAIGPAVHEQAMRRLQEVTGLVPVEYPTTRRLGSTAKDRAADLNAAFADPDIRAILTTVGGEDEITVIPQLDPAAALADPKPVMGYSDNTTSSTGCGPTGSRRTTAAQPRCIWVLGPAWTRLTRLLCVPRS